jgi:hypothetical protein
MQTLVKAPKKVGKYVNTAHVDNVIRNYKKERWIQNSDRIGKEDSLSTWWSIAEMEDFIATAKVHGADGLKFYFGAYDSDYTENPKYAGRQTLVMVGTKEAETGIGIKNKDIYVQTENGSNILAYNRGTICPPDCGPKKPETGLDGDDMLGITIIDRGDKGMLVF